MAVNHASAISKANWPVVVALVPMAKCRLFEFPDWVEPHEGATVYSSAFHDAAHTTIRLLVAKYSTWPSGPMVACIKVALGSKPRYPLLRAIPVSQSYRASSAVSPPVIEFKSYERLTVGTKNGVWKRRRERHEVNKMCTKRSKFYFACL